MWVCGAGLTGADPEQPLGQDTEGDTQGPVFGDPLDLYLHGGWDRPA